MSENHLFHTRLRSVVLNVALKILKLVQSLTWMGVEFHLVAAVTENADCCAWESLIIPHRLSVQSQRKWN